MPVTPMSCVRTPGASIRDGPGAATAPRSAAPATNRGPAGRRSANRCDVRSWQHVVAHFDEESGYLASTWCTRLSLADGHGAGFSSTNRPRRVPDAPKPHRPAYTPGRSSRCALVADRRRTVIESPANAAGRPGRHSPPAPTSRPVAAGLHDPLADEPDDFPDLAAALPWRRDARTTAGRGPACQRRSADRLTAFPGRGCAPASTPRAARRCRGGRLRAERIRLFCNPKDLT